MLKTKWVSYQDDYTNMKIYAVDGYQYGSGNNILARIFADKVDVHKIGKKETRYFPQINNEEKEEVIIIGDDWKGYKSIKDAKKVLIEELEKYLAG